MNDFIEQSKALASETRMKILAWLKLPSTVFSHQETGNPDEIGVCVTLIANKLNMSQPTVSRHLELLRRARFVDVNRIGRWSYFLRNEDEIKAYGKRLNDNL